MRRRPCVRPAFTLVEASVATLIVSVMVAAAVSVVGASARASQLERSWRQGDTLGRALMAEILSKRFADPQGGAGIGLDAGESWSDRATLDDVDDYHGLSELTPNDHAGNMIPWAKLWSRTVAVHNVAAGDPTTSLAAGADTGLKRITVTVTSQAGVTRTLTALKSRTSVIDARGARLNATTLTHARIQFRSGASGSLLVGGAELLNTPSGELLAAPAEIE